MSLNTTLHEAYEERNIETSLSRNFPLGHQRICDVICAVKCSLPANGICATGSSLFWGVMGRRLVVS